jgi:hypothetical protein
MSVSRWNNTNFEKHWLSSGRLSRLDGKSLLDYRDNGDDYTSSTHESNELFGFHLPESDPTRRRDGERARVWITFLPPTRKWRRDPGVDALNKSRLWLGYSPGREKTDSLRIGKIGGQSLPVIASPRIQRPERRSWFWMSMKRGLVLQDSATPNHGRWSCRRDSAQRQFSRNMSIPTVQLPSMRFR